MKLRSHVPDQLPPPGPDLNAIVSAEVMAWQPGKFCGERLSEISDGEHCSPLCILHDPDEVKHTSDCNHAASGLSWEECREGVSEEEPCWSTDDAAAILVLNKMEAEGWRSEYRMFEQSERRWSFWRMSQSWRVIIGHATHASFAAVIVYAAIDAARIMKGESHDA